MSIGKVNTFMGLYVIKSHESIRFKNTHQYQMLRYY